MTLISAVRLLQRGPHRLTSSELVKFMLRATLSLRAHRQWTGYLLNTASGPARLTAQPHLLWKLQRSYLGRNVTIGSKLDWLREHHDWVAEHWPAEFIRALYQDGRVVIAELASASTGKSPGYEVVLSVDQQFAKEGELVISLWRRAGAQTGEPQHRVAAIAFAIHQHGGQWVAHIGCLQGAAGSQGADQVRTATRELQGLRPKQAVVIALYAFIHSHAIDHVRAVANRDHVYQAHWRRRERVTADYDAFWTELGAHEDGCAWRLPAQLGRKAEADIPSRKRSQYRRRHELEDQLIRQISQALAPASGLKQAPQVFCSASSSAAEDAGD